jgi:hypothetical protein
MAERKETPDVLAELLGNPPVPATKEPPTSPQEPPEKETTAQATPTKTTAKKATSAPKRQAKTSSKPGAPSSRPTSTRKISRIEWEYQAVSFQYYNGWRLRYINGDEVENWMESPLIHEYINQVGEQGWEMIAASSGERMYGLSDHQQLFFKRKKV